MSSYKMLDLVSISKSFGSTRALDDVSLTIQPGEIVCLLGPSGCGKSTLLSIVAGLETPDTGEVRWEGENLAGVPAHRRRFGLMFQDYALFLHKNVFENVAFGLRMQSLPHAEIEKAVTDALAQVDLTGFEKRDVNTLSGGEAQRVALARSLAPRPRLLMLDEPLGALDRTLREELLEELRLILRRSPSPSAPPRSASLRGTRLPLGEGGGGEEELTILYVTHDQSEAFALADRVAVMNTGCILQIGAPEEVYEHPASEFVARFLGLTNLLEATPQSDGTYSTLIGPLRISHSPRHPSSVVGRPSSVVLLVRPDAAHLTGNSNPLKTRVVSRSFRGDRVRVTVMAGSGATLVFDFPLPNLPAVGEPLDLYLDPERLTILPNL